MSLFQRPQTLHQQSNSCKFDVNAAYRVMASVENDVCLSYWRGIKSCEFLHMINEITLSVGKQP